MNRLFGNFLVEQGYITQEQLLTAIVHQLKVTPSTAEVVFEKKLLGIPEQLLIFEIQQRKGLDYRSAAKEANLWGDSLFESVSSIIQKMRPPLGEVLTELQFIAAEMLAEALNSYVENFGSSTLEGQPIPSEPKQAPVLNSTLSVEYHQNINEKILPALRDVVSGFQNESLSRDEYDKLLRKATSELTALKAAATFLGAKISMQLSVAIAEELSRVRQSEGKVSEKDILDILKPAIHVFEGLAQLIVEFKSEEGFESDTNLQDLFRRSHDQLEHLSHAVG